MSYIHGSPDNHYTPSQNLKNLFEECIIKPFGHDLPALAADVKNNRIYYWEDIARILKQGQSDFDEVSFDKPTNEYYFPQDKVALYCVHHMPRHLFGSYHIFTNYLTPLPETNQVLFIDFGCGPLTSGIAFRAFAGERETVYVGIDRSQTMLDKAAALNRYGLNRYSSPFFDTIAFIRDSAPLPGLLNEYIDKGDSTQILFNFCYFFSSPTVDIETLSDVLIQLMRDYSQHNICFIYQNPDHRYLSEARRLNVYGKWEHLKTNLSEFSGQRLRSGVETFSYDRLINGVLHKRATVYSEVLCYDSN